MINPDGRLKFLASTKWCEEIPMRECYKQTVCGAAMLEIIIRSVIVITLPLVLTVPLDNIRLAVRIVKRKVIIEEFNMKSVILFPPYLKF